MYDNKKVLNDRFARLIRTLSYAFILIASFILGVRTIVNINWNIIQEIFIPINNFINAEISFINNYLYLILLIGLLGLIWTQSRSYLFRIITTLLLVVVSLINDNLSVIRIFDFIPNITIINELLDSLIETHNWLLLVIQIIPLLFTYFLLNARKPSRLSLSVVVSGVGFLMLRLVLNELPILIGNDWLTRAGYNTILNINLVVSYSFMTVGSILGILGFFRK